MSSFNLAELLIKYGKHTPNIEDTNNRFYKAPKRGQFIVNRIDGKVYIGNGNTWKLYAPLSHKLVVETEPKMYIPK